MARTGRKPILVERTPFIGAGAQTWPRKLDGTSGVANGLPDQDRLQQDRPEEDRADPDDREQRSLPRNRLHELLAFSALVERARNGKALGSARNSQFAADVALAGPAEQFALDEVLQLVAERGTAITGADGLAIALAENNEIVLRAAAGTVRPDVGARIDRESAFSGACFSRAEIVNCDDTEVDLRVNREACRRLGARSMVAVPLCGQRRRVIGLLEAFSSWPFGFSDKDVLNLTLLAELIVGALRPEEEDRFAEAAEAAATKLEPAPRADVAAVASVPTAPVEVDRTEDGRTNATAPAAVDAAKPFEEMAVTPTPAPAIPDRSAPLSDESPASPKIVAAETRTASAVPPPTQPSANRRLGIMAPLMVVAIVVMIAAGVWWKMRAAQPGGGMVRAINVRANNARTDKALAEQQASKPGAANASHTGSSAGANRGLKLTTAESGVDAISESPATAQELAKFPRVTAIQYSSTADSSTVVIHLEDQVQYEAHRLAGPDRIYFDLHDTQLASDLAGKSIDVGDALLKRIRVAQPVAGMTRIVLDTRAGTNFSVSLEQNPYQLVVEVRKEVRKDDASPQGAANLLPHAAEPEASKLAATILAPSKEDLQLRARVPKMRIVVDAGHGGWDLGTVGRGGLLEKDLVLEIAQRLGKLLETRLGSEVILTRSDDNYISLEERAEIANQAQADLFVSVHANYSDMPSARGVETYYTNFFSAPGSKEAVSREAVSKNATAPELTTSDLRDRIEQSRRLAASVQRSLFGTLSVQNPGLRDRGIKESGFVVLTESAMPGILAEVSFVSSPRDEQKLRRDGYREEIAEALYKGIEQYAASSKGMKMATK